MQQLHLGLFFCGWIFFSWFIWRKPSGIAWDEKKHKNHWRNNLTAAQLCAGVCLLQPFLKYFHCMDHGTFRIQKLFVQKRKLKFPHFCNPRDCPWTWFFFCHLGGIKMWLHPGPISDARSGNWSDLSQCIGSLGLKLLGKSGDLGEVPYPKTAWGNALRMFWRFLRTGFVSGAITSWFYSVLSSQLGGLVTQKIPSRELTYPPNMAFWRFFLFSRWDMLVSWRVFFWSFFGLTRILSPKSLMNLL